jgi:hypothetical protein
VGFFEVAQEVEGDAEVHLHFKAEEMNDVLKSLTVHDPAGKVISVSYDSHKAISQLLQEIALELPKSGGSAALLARLQGAEVKVQTHSRGLRGSIVGLEPRISKLGDQLIEESWLTLWSDTQTLVNLNLAEIQQLELCDETLRSDLSYCLDVMLKTHKRDAKQLAVITRGQGKRELHISYLVEAPAWKSSYRILLPAEAHLPPFWEGWALVDNPRDEDWDDVELTLVAGLPVSFRHDLYSPRYVERREIKVEREATVGPLSVSGSVPRAQAADPFACPPNVDPFACPAPDPFAVADPFAADPFAAPNADPFAASADPFMAPSMAFAATPTEVARERAAQVVAQNLGELFHYRLRHPVTVKRNQSALVPIVGQEASGGKVVLYNAKERARNPFAAVELTNTTGLTLEGGPLLVIEENSYAGEAMLDTLKPDERRIVPYAVDLAVVVESKHNQRRESVHLVKAVRGQLTLYSAELDSCLYLFQNNDDRDKTLWLEHPLQSGWDLYDTPEESERSATHYRFRLALKARAQLDFKVTLKRVHTQTLSIGGLNLQQVAAFRSGGYFSAEAEKAMDALVVKLQKRNDSSLEMQTTEQRIREVQGEIERCRSMLPSLANSADEMRLRSQYVSTMEAGESELKQLKQRILHLRADIHRQSEEISAFARSLQFEKTL